MFLLLWNQWINEYNNLLSSVMTKRAGGLQVILSDQIWLVSPQLASPTPEVFLVHLWNMCELMERAHPTASSSSLHPTRSHPLSPFLPSPLFRTGGAQTQPLTAHPPAPRSTATSQTTLRAFSSAELQPCLQTPAWIRWSGSVTLVPPELRFSPRSEVWNKMCWMYFLRRF